MNTEVKEQAYLNPLVDIKKAALEHYEEISSRCHHWMSFIPAAIKAYQPEGAISPNILGIMRVLFEATLPADMPLFDRDAEWSLFLYRNELTAQTKPAEAATPPKEAEGESLEELPPLKEDIYDVWCLLGFDHVFSEYQYQQWEQFIINVEEAATAPLLTRIKELQEELALRPQQQTK